MSKRISTAGITYQEGKGFKKCIGWYQHADGRKLPKIHWLGHDPKHARYVATILQETWQMLERQGRGWKPKDIANVKEWVAGCGETLREALNGVDQQEKAIKERREALLLAARVLPNAGTITEAAPTAESSPAPTEPQRPMLYAAIKAFTEAIKGKPSSDKHKQRAIQVVDVNLKAARKDCLLADVDYAWLDSLCNHYKGRPKNLKDGKPMAPAGVANVLRYLRLFFVWVDDSEWGGWQAPRKLLKPFRVRQSDLMTSVEMRVAGNIQQFTIETLKALYKVATERQRAIMLASLFTGATQQELAILEQSEFDLDTAMLHHYRGKTGVEGKYWLPPELINFLRKDFAKRPKDKLAFRTSDGNALVTFKDGKQTSDAVRQTWDDLRDLAGLPAALSFKYLRKYLGDWMKRNAGEHIAQVALSQRPTTVLSKNYSSARDFDAFVKFQKKMHRELKAAGLFVKENAKPKAKAKASEAA